MEQHDLGRGGFQVSFKILARDTFLCCWQRRQQLQVIL